ncbi:MAG: hypothetical protein LBR80_08910 [Deltaproteobacteria bacterium]|nr:hypothetical protein [Deltaproteobacteria bacterium]
MTVSGSAENPGNLRARRACLRKSASSSSATLFLASTASRLPGPEMASALARISRRTSAASACRPVNPRTTASSSLAWPASGDSVPQDAAKTERAFLKRPTASSSLKSIRWQMPSA